MPLFAIARAAKIKSPSELAAMAAHHARLRPTPNADSSRANEWLLGSGNPAVDVEHRIAESGVRLRRNGVRAIELVLTGSPEFFRPGDPSQVGSWDQDRLEAWSPRALRWAQQYFGKTNTVSAVLHLDESTPHLHVVVVPVDDTPRQRGSQVRLNAARWLDGREKLAQLQDGYAEAMAHLGLERGIQGRRVKHKAVSQMYARMSRDTQAAAEDRQRAQDLATAIQGFADGKWRVVEKGGEVGVKWRSEADKLALKPILLRTWPQVHGWALRVSQGLKKRIRDVLADARSILAEVKQLPRPPRRALELDREVRWMEAAPELPRQPRQRQRIR